MELFHKEIYETWNKKYEELYPILLRSNLQKSQTINKQEIKYDIMNSCHHEPIKLFLGRHISDTFRLWLKSKTIAIFGFGVATCFVSMRYN